MIALGLGSNIGDREKNIIAAVRLLAQHPKIKVIKVSSLYQTAPVGYLDQPDFLNAVISIDTNLSAQELLVACLTVERRLGRKRELRWGPRTIDIDILLYDDIISNTPQLVLPHPRLHERRFVLVPLAEIAPGIAVCNGETAAELLTKCQAEDVVFYKELIWEEE